MNSRAFLPLCAIIAFLSASVLAGCAESSSTSASQTAFHFTVLTVDSMPVADARVLFTKGTASFVGRTNGEGSLQVPVEFRGGTAAVSKTNYRPTRLAHSTHDTLILIRASKRLRAIGAVEGTAVRFGGGSLVTFDRRGIYRAYDYGNAAVIRQVETRFSDTIVAINRYTAFGDTLWFTTRDTAIYAISLVDPTAPRVLHRFRLPAVPGPIAVRDSFIILGEEQYPAAARVMVFGPSGLRQISSIQYFYPKQLCLIGSYAVFFDGDPFYAAFSLADPAVPLLVHLNSNPGFTAALLQGKRLLLGPPEVTVSGSQLLYYTTWDISYPVIPLTQHSFSDSYITGVGDGTTMVGSWQHDPGLMTIVQGTYGGSFLSVACRSWSTMPAIDGAAPPFFLFDGTLWVLEPLP